MKTLLFILFLIVSACAFAQLSFKTLAPQKAVVEGESFQVQYILQDAKKPVSISPPFFKGFRFVSGPNVYNGNVFGNQTLQNVVYTLEAVKPGVYIIEGATAVVNGKLLRSNDTQLEVISKEDAADDYNRAYNSINSDYFLRPGEDPYKKMKENLFVRVMVDKQKCRVGEPVLATFKLYSRLESKSDVVKNPGLYGFTVHDMVNLADNIVMEEKLNGKTFDVHTIRKVQLYPLQAGDYIIDPMEVRNRVEFSVSAVNKKTEQEIVEGMLGELDEEVHPPGTEIFQSANMTETIRIHVDALPEKNKPDTFSGAVGNFRINAKLKQDKLHLNEQGFIELVISGKGNFVQLDAPRVNWPTGLEAFQPKLVDQLDNMNVPLRGSRSFIYPFVGSASGTFKIPPFKFSFFDSDSNSYRIIQTDSLEVTVSDKVLSQQTSPSEKMKGTGWNVLLIALLAIVLASGIYFVRERVSRTSRVAGKEVNPVMKTETHLFIDTEEPGFYSAVYNALWKAAASRYQLQGSRMNKDILRFVMESKNVSQDTIEELITLIRSCEIGMFTTVNQADDKKELLSRAEKIINQLEIS